MFLSNISPVRLVRRLLGRRNNRMDVILHLGAHRTASTSFRAFMRDHQRDLAENDIAFWGQDRLRAGLFAGLMARRGGVMPDTPKFRDRATQKILMELDRLEKSGVKQLVVSEPAMAGSMMGNLRAQKLYPDFADRLGRFADAFGGRCRQIALSIRSYEGYWTSAMGHAIPRGFGAPSADTLDRLVTQPRRWSSMINECKSVFPNAEVLVWPFEAMAGHPARQLALMTGVPLDVSRRAQPWENAAPSPDELAEVFRDRAEIPPQGDKNRWAPFQGHHRLTLREDYQQDLTWLRNGAQGQATYAENAGDVLRLADDRELEAQAHRGHGYDPSQRYMV